MKCPYCGQERREEPGDAAPADRAAANKVAPIRTNRIARPRRMGGPGRPGTGYVSPMDVEFDEGDDAA